MGTMHASPFTFTIQFILQLVHCKLDTSLLKIAQQYNFRMLFVFIYLHVQGYHEKKDFAIKINYYVHSTSFEICAMKICLKSLTFLHMFLTHEKHQKDVLKVGTAAMPTFLKGFLTQQRKRGYF